MKHLAHVLSLSALLFFAADGANAQTFSTPFQAGSQATFPLTGSFQYTCFVDGAGAYELSLSVVGPSGETIAGIHPDADSKALQSQLNQAFMFGDTTLSNNSIAFNTTLGAAGTGDYKFTMASVAPMSSNPGLICISNLTVCNFNTFAADAIFLELTNNGAKEANISAAIIDFQDQLTTLNVVVPAGVRRDFALRPLLSASNYGIVRVRSLIATTFFGEGVSSRISHYRNAELLNTQICGLSGIGDR